MGEGTEEKRNHDMLKQENGKVNGLGKYSLSCWVPFRVPALRFMIINLKPDKSLFLGVFLHPHLAAGI